MRSAPPPSQGEWHKTELSWGYAVCECVCVHVFVSKSQPRSYQTEEANRLDQVSIQPHYWLPEKRKSADTDE